jgi:hypothetical protein
MARLTDFHRQHPATNVDSKRGKRERATRGFFSLTHLGSRRREERAPRAVADRWWWCLGAAVL